MVTRLGTRLFEESVIFYIFAGIFQPFWRWSAVILKHFVQCCHNVVGGCSLVIAQDDDGNIIVPGVEVVHPGGESGHEACMEIQLVNTIHILLMFQAVSVVMIWVNFYNSRGVYHLFLGQMFAKIIQITRGRIQASGAEEIGEI
jgi:hypothetical protein